jgi:SAM-dependent methyltransferase
MNSEEPVYRQNLSKLDYSGIGELIESEEGLKNYSEDIVKKIKDALSIPQGKEYYEIIDFGAGTGQLAQIWREKFGVSPICIEIDPNLRNMLKSKGFRTFENIASLSNISLIYSSNVLEHIENDVEILIDIRKRMQPGGRIVIYVPALPFLFSGLDLSVGHYRRYTKKELINKMISAGFNVEKCTWNDSLGVLASLSLKIFGFKGKSGLGNKKSLIIYDRVFYPISRILDKLLFKKIIGKNLLLIGKN